MFISIFKRSETKTSLFQMFALSSISRRWLSRSFDLGGRMKELNDRGEYEKSLSLFRSNGQEGARTLVINQALKASIELKDFAQGKAIHRSLSPFFLNNSFIRSSLIRLYCKSNVARREIERIISWHPSVWSSEM